MPLGKVRGNFNFSLEDKRVLVRDGAGGGWAAAGAHVCEAETQVLWRGRGKRALGT